MRGLVVAWVVLAAAGWGVTQWLGEPAPTSGPGAVTPPVSGSDPGPQPEYDCDEARRAAKSSPTPDPLADGLLYDSAVGEDGQAHLSQVLCDTAESG